MDTTFSEPKLGTSGPTTGPAILNRRCLSKSGIYQCGILILFIFFTRLFFLADDVKGGSWTQGLKDFRITMNQNDHKTKR